HWKSITGYNEAQTAARRVAVRNGTVLAGIDVLEAHGFEAIRQGAETRKAGLLTNQTGLDREGRRTIDVLAKAPGISLTAIFSAEHGITGEQDTLHMATDKDPATGLPVFGVYGGTDSARRPPLDEVKKLDLLFIDLQDAGVYFYTYETTLGYFLEA